MPSGSITILNRSWDNNSVLIQDACIMSCSMLKFPSTSIHPSSRRLNSDKHPILNNTLYINVSEFNSISVLAPRRGVVHN
jgi:hypothetical protein